MRTFLLFQEAVDTILASVPRLPSERVALEVAVARVLAEAVEAPEDIPPFDRASMDGYAIQTARPGSGAQERSLIGELQAGSVFSGTIDARSALRIMTGAQMPAGANAVVEAELATEDVRTVRFSEDIRPGRNIRHRGEDLRKGALALSKGVSLDAPHVGLLASIGRETVTVSRRPSISVVVTGSELLGVHAQPLPGKIRESNSWVLGAALRKLGLPLQNVESVGDEPGAIASAVERALSADVVILSGGVSVGKYDYVLEALKRLDVELLFWKVRMRPGMPFAFGRGRRETRIVPLFALPGNPVSTYVTFRLLVQPALESMQGRTQGTKLPSLRAVLGSSLTKRDDKRHFVRGTLRWEGPVLTVEPFRTQSSGVLSSLSESNCLIVLPEETRTLQAGEGVEVILL